MSETTNTDRGNMPQVGGSADATTIDTIARAFIAELRTSEVTPEQYRQICQRNARETNPAICHSHDFCDANMAMHAVWTRHYDLRVAAGWDPTDEDCTTWDRIWDRAKVIMIADARTVVCRVCGKALTTDVYGDWIDATGGDWCRGVGDDAQAHTPGAGA